ncbi:hypothetical protein ABU16_1552 [Bacillus subtilis]|nr:hypothetical protein ABU16_1552 [Bacillus subtilis]
MQKRLIHLLQPIFKKLLLLICSLPNISFWHNFIMTNKEAKRYKSFPIHSLNLS